MWNAARIRRLAIPVTRGLSALALATAVAFPLHLNSAAASLLFLIVVLLNGLDGGLLVSLPVSLAAVALLDYFFIAPLFTLAIADPGDVASLAAFLATSLVLTRLAANAREKARLAEEERRNLQRLYTLAERLLALDPLEMDRQKLVGVVQQVFDLNAACLFDGGSAETALAGHSSLSLPARSREAFIAGRDTDDPTLGVSLRCLRSGGRTWGAIGFEGLHNIDVVAGPVTALVAAAIERAKSARAAGDAASEARAESLRGAILDALAHEFKTPLATILTAAGGLREAGPLRPEQAELAELVETEASRLSNLSTRLLRLARLDREEVQPQLRRVDIEALVRASVDRCARQSPDREVRFTGTGGPEEAPADPELFQLAFSQLLDNACRYSPAGSLVKVSLDAGDDTMRIRVWNGGSSIPAAEMHRVFDRFFRGSHGRQLAAGSGLGLYVARKIAIAHGWTLELEPSRPPDYGVAFRITIPLPGGRFDRAESTTHTLNRG